MESGAKQLTIILLIALALGVLVLMLNPYYRQSLIATYRGHPDVAPIWQSNLKYYPEIVIPQDIDHDPK